MIVWTARNRPVPRKRAMPSANWPTASGFSRRKLPMLRVRPRGTSSRWVSATAGPLTPVLGQRRLGPQRIQVVEDAADQAGRRLAEQPLDVREAQVAPGGRGRRRAAD